MAGLLVRILVAVVACVLLFQAIPLVFQLLDLSVEPAMHSLLKLVIAGLALVYIWRGPDLWPVR